MIDKLGVNLTVEVDKKVDLEQEQQISNEQDRNQTSPDSIQKYDILDGKGTLPTTPTQGLRTRMHWDAVRMQFWRGAPKLSVS